MTVRQYLQYQCITRMVNPGHANKFFIVINKTSQF